MRGASTPGTWHLTLGPENKAIAESEWQCEWCDTILKTFSVGPVVQRLLNCPKKLEEDQSTLDTFADESEGGK